MKNIDQFIASSIYVHLLVVTTLIVLGEDELFKVTLKIEKLP